MTACPLAPAIFYCDVFASGFAEQKTPGRLNYCLDQKGTTRSAIYGLNWAPPQKQVKKQIETHQFTRQNGRFLTDLSVFRCPMALLDSAKISSSSTGRRPELKWSSPDWQITQVPISCSKLSRASWFGLSTHSHCSTCSPHCSRGPETVWRYIGNEMKHKTRSRNRLLYHLKNQQCCMENTA